MATGLLYFVTSLQVPARQGYLLEGFVKPPASLSTFLTLFHHQMDFAQFLCLPDNLAASMRILLAQSPCIPGSFHPEHFGSGKKEHDFT